MKKLLSLALAAAMLCSVCPAWGEAAVQTDAAAQLLEEVRGTYDELFTVINAPEYDALWLEECAAFVGEEAAPMAADMLKSACAATVYGQEAADAYAAAPETAAFDCFFINGVTRFVFDGSRISGLDAEGNTVFDHEYAIAGDFSIAGVMDGFLYETADADAGEFTYFLLMPDTPASTWHIEFRYGSDPDALAEYASGPYA